MNLSGMMLCCAVGVAAGPEAAPPAGGYLPPPPTAAVAPAWPDAATADGPACGPECFAPSQERRLFQSDHAFDGFIGPITNPILSKDPRSNTYIRFLAIQNTIPGENLLGGNDFQAYAAQANLALTDRLSFIADKDGYASLQTSALGKHDGFLNLAAGLKYAFIRDVERQLLVTGGFMYEIPSGEEAVFQGSGPGVFTVFGTVGKEFNCKWHVLNTAGYQFPLNTRENSNFFYNSLHIDRQCFGWLYPLVEVNWFHWTDGGNVGLPAKLGEGDGLINFGTTGVNGNNLVTGAVGLKAIITQSLHVGAAWEIPLSNRKDLIDNRVTAELILRY